MPNKFPVNYIPHHGIWQKADGKEKLRVVFNASRKSSSGYSLNDILHVGKKLQSDIFTVLLRWRRHKIVFCSEIKMMFRMIKVDDRDVDLQRILWRRPGDKSVTHFQLLTVTYGTASAPFLAGRVLKELAEKEKDNYPKAARVINEETYVDDICTEADNHTSQKRAHFSFITGGFPLRKWSSNNPKILEGLSTEERLRPEWINFQTDGPIKTLGVSWDASSDNFCFKAPIDIGLKHLTKRQFLSQIARLFDPNGWLAPVTVEAKIFMQQLWKHKLGWDDVLPDVLNFKWVSFLKTLPDVSKLQMPRWVSLTKDSTVQLHAFGDTSKKAYAAAIYIRVIIKPVSAHGCLLQKLKLLH